MKRKLLVILLSCIFDTSSLSLTACIDTSTESIESESVEEHDSSEDQEDEVESIRDAVDESEEQRLEEGSPEIVRGEDIPSDNEPNPYVAPEQSEPEVTTEAYEDLQTPSEEFTCPQCWKVVDHLTYGGVCEKCYAASTNVGSFGYCSYCGNALSEAEVNMYSPDRCFNCKNVCCYCGGYVENDQIIDYGHAVCGNCYMAYEMLCQNCGNVGNLTWSGDGRILCPNCIASMSY